MWNCVKTDIINVKLQIGRQIKRQLNGGSPLRWWRSALDCSAVRRRRKGRRRRRRRRFTDLLVANVS